MFFSLLLRSRIHALLASIVVLATAARADNEWVEVRSPNFSIITDAGEKRGREAALRFEQMRYIFGTLIRKNMVNIPVPLQIVAFRNKKGFRDFVPLWKGKPVNLAGLYQGGEDRNFILLDLSVEDPYSTVFHEYAHLLLNGNYPPTQLWFDEGFAELYRTAQVMGKEARVGVVADDLGYTLQELRLLPVVDLFSISHDSKEYNEDGDRRHLFYAQSWLVVHYLFDTKKLDKAGSYFNLTQNEHVPIPQAIQQAFGMSPRELDKEIERYFRANRFGYWQFDIPRFETSLYTTQKLKPVDAQAMLADVHSHSPHYQEKAIAEFQAILNTEPNHAASQRGLGYAYLRKGDFAQAGEHFARAAALDSNDARVHYYTALLMNRETGGQINNPGDMAAHLKRAIQLDPTLADAYHLLAYLQLTRGSSAEALESIKTALGLSPRNQYYESVLGQVYIAQKKWDEATAVFKRLESSDNPELAARARTSLEVIADYKQNPYHAQWAEMRERTPRKEWGTTPSRERLEEEAAARPTQEVKPQTSSPDLRPVKFLKGRLLNVACLANTKAILTITTVADSARVASLGRKGTAKAPASVPAGKTVKLVVSDLKRVLVMGADGFSCQWHDQRVAVNYRAGGDLDGEVMSLELQ
jgi:Flp pilus assembly protein TadD